MLKISVHEDEIQVRLQVEGAVIGVWVNELEQTWRMTVDGLKGRSLCVDLTGTTRVSASGRDLLAVVYQHGARFLVSGPWMKSLISEITGSAETSGLDWPGEE